MKKKLYIGIVFLSVVILISSSGLINIDAEESMIIPKNREEHLQKLEFLPYFLDGTILDGSKKVIETRDGKVPEFIDDSKCDRIISTDERIKIIENARKEFIKQYGMDPYPPEEIRTPAPTLEELEKRDIKIYSDVNYVDSLSLPDGLKGIWDDHPHENGYGDMYVAFFPSTGSQAPNDVNTLLERANYGWGRFSSFGISTGYTVYWGYWNCDVGTNSYDQLDDFVADYKSWNLNHPDYVVNMGLNKQANHNGIANTSYFWCITTEDCTGLIEHEKSIVSQHELTRCIGHIHDDSCMWPWCHPSGEQCVVNYWYMWTGTTVWCDSCWDEVNYHIWNW